MERFDAMKTFITSLVLALCTVTVVSAQWLPTTTDELLDNSHVVVIGKITAMHRGQQGPQAFDYAELTISRVLKGQVQESTLHLAFPGEKRGYLLGTKDFVSTRLTTDVFFDLNMEGIWFLQGTNLQNVFMATHPARFKPLFFREQVEASIARHR